MPTAFVAIGEYVVYLAATWGASTATAVAIGSFVTTALTYGTYYFLLNKATGLLLEKGGGRRVNSGLEVAITDTAAEGLAIYGYMRCNGVNKIPPITGGEDGKYLEQVIELALHDCWHIPMAMADDQLIPDQVITAITGSTTDGKLTDTKFLNKMWLRRYTTTVGRTVDWILNDRYPNLFTSAFVGKGRTYAAITYEWDDKMYSGGVPNMVFHVNGKLCYDPRKDGTQSGGSGAHRVADSTTWEFTVNPALHWADYAMASFGGNIPSAKINWPSVMAAANICDATVLVPDVFTAYATDGTAAFITGNTAGKTSGADAYDSSVRSTTSKTPEEKPYLCCQVTANPGAIFVGLTTDPTASADYTTMDYAVMVNAIGNSIQIWENNVAKASFSYRATPVIEITTDGSWVYYYIDGELGRAVPLTSMTDPLFFDSTFFRVGDTIKLMCKRRYTSNVRIGLARDWRDNARLFIDAMVGRMIRRDGIWFIYAGAYDAPTFTVEKKDWLQIESIKTVAPRDNGRWNTVHVWYTDKQRNWQREECFPRRNATYRADDNNEEIPLELEQPACTDEFEAQRKGEFLLRQSRNQIALVGVLPPRFHHIATGEMGAFTFEDFGWSSKLMRVRAMDMLNEGQVRIAIAEEQAADWTDLAASEYNQPSASGIPEVNPTTPSAPTNLTINANFNGTLQVEIFRPLIFPQGSYYRLYRTAVSTNAAAGAVVYEGVTNKINIVAPSSLHYYFAQVIANSYFGPFYPTTGTAGVVGLPLGWTTNQINSNAATDVFVAYNSAVASNNLFAGQLINMNWTPPGLPCTALLTATGKLRRTIGGGASFFTIRLEQYPNLSETYDTFMATSDSVFVLQKEFAINSSLAVQSAGVTFSASSHGVATYSDWRLKVEVIKR